jgi:hypothetical protein
MTSSWIRDIELQLMWMSSGWTWDIKLELNLSCTALVDGKLQHWAKLCILGQGDTLQTSHNYLLHSHISRFTWRQVASQTTLKSARTTSSRTLTDPGFSAVLRVAQIVKFHISMPVLLNTPALEYTLQNLHPEYGWMTSEFHTSFPVPIHSPKC